MSPPLHSAHPVSNLPPVPPGYVSCPGSEYYDSNFTSEEAHSARKNRYFWVVRLGPKQGFYSTQATALQNIPPRCSLDDALERFDTHTQMRAVWPRHCFHHHGKCAVHFACVHYACHAHYNAPTNAKVEAQNTADATAAAAAYISQALNDAGTLVLTASRAANRTLRAVQTSVSRASSAVVSPPPTTSLAPPPPPSVSRTPRPSNAWTSVSRSASVLPSSTRACRGRAVARPSSRPSLPPPYSSPPPLNDTPMLSPSPSPPLSRRPQDKPMRMNTGFTGSQRCWKEKQQAEAHVEITHAPSAGVVVGLVPKAEPDSDPELDGIVKREATTASPRAPLFDPNSSDEEGDGRRAQPRPQSIKREREPSPHTPLFDSDSGEDAASVEMLCVSSSRSPSLPPSSVAPSVLSIASTAPSVISVSSTSSLSASIPSTGGS
ncbi:hypothetical protein B0H16DRAFT_1732609 [Mycena metata]|uniref:Uncharacterized protein n=1 Tax=Mycena metata TaxID=1033252 RepID=A0AAD7I2Z4_9AGAR|nr:hypothetical protein B0H16DRAFT_1732609 [Mycena metata]